MVAAIEVHLFCLNILLARCSNTHEDSFPFCTIFQEIDPKAGGGCTMTIGQMVRSFLLKLEWYGTLFPRIPVPVQKDIEVKLRAKGLCDDHKRTAQDGWGEAEDFARRSRAERWVSLSAGMGLGSATKF